jgi:hypothetical protein
MSTIGNNSGVLAMSPEDIRKVADAIETLNDSMTRVAAERDLVKETVNKLHEEIGFPKRLLRRLAKTHYNRSFEMDTQENRDFESAYETITSKK